MRGSPLGIGSDIGGSIRAPAAFNGIWGLKPTSQRISLGGIVVSNENTYGEGIRGVLGPMANSADDLELLMETYLASEPWAVDQQCIPLPWRNVPTPEPTELTIGIIFDDGVVKPHPPTLRALKEIQDKLTKAGVKSITWEPHRVYEAVQIASVMYNIDGNHSQITRLAASGEPLVPSTAHALAMGEGDRLLSSLEGEFYNNTREVLRQEYLELFTGRKVDFILTPTYVGTAPKPSTLRYWGYTSLWNILDQTAVTFPTGLYGDKKIDLKDEDYKPRNAYEEYEYHLYDPDSSDGMPIGLTLVGKRYTEESTLKAAKVLHDIIAEN